MCAGTLSITHIVFICICTHSFYGVFEFAQPTLHIVDPQLIQRICVGDFAHFVDHQPAFPNAERQPVFGRLLVNLRGAEWRQQRSVLTPCFTGHRMRSMFALVERTAADTVQHLWSADAAAMGAEPPLVCEMKDVCMRFSNDVIAAVAYGERINSHCDRDNRMLRTACEITDFHSLRVAAKVLAICAAPNLSRLLGLRLFARRHMAFFDAIVRRTIDARTPHNADDELSAARPPPADVLHVLLEAQRKSLLRAADVPAQCFLMYIVAFETVASVLAFAVHELMDNPEAQRRARAEVDDVRTRLGAGAPLTYERMQSELRYLDCVVAETLRKWPVSLATNRQCSAAYDGLCDEASTDAGRRGPRLEPGDAITIPIFALHRDAEHFAEPERFEPERFSDERKHEIRPFTYLPFGAGPRSCIGARYTAMVAKTFLFHLLTRFTFERSAERTRSPIRLQPHPFLLVARDGLHVWLKPRVEA